MLGTSLLPLAGARLLRRDRPFPSIGTIKSIFVSSCGYLALHADGTLISYRIGLAKA